MKFKSKPMYTSGLALLAAAGFSVSAHATYDPNWERPIKTAKMKVIEANGDYSTAKDVGLTMTHRDGSGTNPTGLILKIDGQSGTFVVAEVTDAGCGSVSYVAHSETKPNVRYDSHAVITLTDHSKRICLDYRPYIWEMSVVKTKSGKNGPETSTLKASGNHEPVFTIMNAESKLRAAPTVHVLACSDMNGRMDDNYSVAILHSLDSNQTFATITHATLHGVIELLRTQVVKEGGENFRYIGQGFELSKNAVQPEDHPGFLGRLKAETNDHNKLDMAVTCVFTR